MKSFFYILAASLILGLFLVTKAQVCSPSGQLIGTTPLLQCNTDNDSSCCVDGESYNKYECSPAVSHVTRARMTLNSFEEGGDGGGPSACGEKFHDNNSLVVTLSTGWFNGRGLRARCNKRIRIRVSNGMSVLATVVDECDSAMGCDQEHAYQPPCGKNIVDASSGVWRALRVPEHQWGDLNITWSDVVVA